MNFLSPDDIFSGVRRKSLCNGAIVTLSSKNGATAGDSANATPSKNKKERRRGSFNEPTSNGGRRSSLVSRWFKHISDAAEQYKPRSKNVNHEPVDDPAIATLPHSNTKESLELTPERPPPLSATATVTTTPLAPMMPVASSTTAYNNNNNDIQMRNGRRESTPLPMADSSAAAYHKQRLSQNELAPPSVNRTMSTRSCGESNNNNYSVDTGGPNGVTLRHTQSARQANAAGSGGGSADDGSAGVGGNASKRDSASIVYSNNSNNTRTLMQSSPPLVEPTAIQICISAAHTAEPVLTPAERLRRLDASIRDGLLEKQKIICDMFRLPVEHFHEIVDIAAMPEAPKDSADIALAAYAQVQSLTEVLNDYMHVSPEQEISAVSTAVCDHCHEKQQQQQRLRPVTPLGGMSPSTTAETPPPLPPPNKQPSKAQQQTPAPTVTKLQTPALEEADIHEDDDGYCEIDELRLPALPPVLSTSTATSTSAMAKSTKSSSPPPPLPPPAGNFKQPPTPPPPAAPVVAASAAAMPELVKRQSTISADSIPEESADEVTQAMDDTGTTETTKEDQNVEGATKEKEEKEKQKEKEKCNEEEKAKEQVEETKENQTEKDNETAVTDKKTDDETQAEMKATSENAECDKTNVATSSEEAKVETSVAGTASEKLESSEANEANNALDALAALNKLSTALSSMVDGTTQTLPMSLMAMMTAATTTTQNISTNGTKTNVNGVGSLLPPCGPNRIQHANSLEPSVPCHALSSIVSTLNSQISLLLPKINERDMERERLRKENQHLRELLNAMHERQRVESKLETPTDITISVDADDDIDIDGSSTTSITPTPSPLATTAPTTIITETTNIAEAEN